jgi:TolA-binding protein
MSRLVQKLFDARPNGSQDTVTVDVRRLKSVLWLIMLLLPLSSLSTFVVTGQRQLNDMRADMAQQCARLDKKDMEHDAAFALIRQQLEQVNGNIKLLLDIELEKRGKR